MWELFAEHYYRGNRDLLDTPVNLGVFIFFVINIIFISILYSEDRIYNKKLSSLIV